MHVLCVQEREGTLRAHHLVSCKIILSVLSFPSLSDRLLLKKFRVPAKNPSTSSLCTRASTRVVTRVHGYTHVMLCLSFHFVPCSVVHQLGLDEREINAVLRGHVTKTSAGVQLDDSSEELPATETGQRPVSPGDVCPICQDKMIENVQRLTCCKYAISDNNCNDDESICL